MVWSGTEVGLVPTCSSLVIDGGMSAAILGDGLELMLSNTSL